MTSQNDNSGEESCWKNFKKAILPTCFSILIGFVAAFFLPKIIGEEFSVRSAARAYSPLVGASRGTEGRDKVSVLLIDDRSLQNAHQSWPASYGYYARLVDALVRYRAKAVFIDVVFASSRDDPSLTRFTESVCRASEAGTRVYLAARRNETGSFKLRPEIQALVPRCVQPVAIEYDPDALDQMAWNYRLAPEQTPDGPKLSSVAATMYQDLAGRPLQEVNLPLAINWGYEPAERGVGWLVPVKSDKPGEVLPQAATYASYCRSPDNEYYETLPPAVRSIFWPEDYKPFCVFNNTLYPADLVTASEDDERRLETNVQDRVVMVGMALQGSNDRVTSPLHGNIPGVYMHAAALDNLLFYGDDFKRNAGLGEEGRWRVLVLLTIGFLAMVCMNAVGKCFKKRFSFEPEKCKSQSCRRACSAGDFLAAKGVGFIFYTVFFAGMIWFGQKFLNLGVLAVADVAGFAILSEWLNWGDRLANWWSPSKESASEHSAT